MVYSLFKFLAFKIDPELMHVLSGKMFQIAPRLMSKLIPGIKIQDSKYSVESNGLKWRFPVGVAAGLDKEGSFANYLSCLGFGAVEIGTVTPRAQEGNEKPRLFRLIDDHSLRNHMGLPNQGYEALLLNLRGYEGKSTIGINLGKNSDTAEEDAWKDYVYLYDKFAIAADYLVINVSCPNVEGLTGHQTGEMLDKILEPICKNRDEESVKLFLKISPGLSDVELLSIVESVRKYKLNGIIATNTIKMLERGAGGVSGQLLFEEARRTRNFLLDELKTDDDIDVIGVGGFSNPCELIEFWERGGKFAQIYTSFIYQGPKILREIKLEIDRVMKERGVDTFQQLVSSS